MHLDNETKLIRDILLVGQRTVSGTGEMFATPERDLVWESKALTTSKTWRAYYYINNPSGTVRWFFPKESHYPAYLSLYNSAHWKAKLYKLGTFASFGLGMPGLLSSGRFWLEGQEQLPLEEALQTVPHDTYGVFTGTVGENRKSIIALAQNHRVTHFAKLAHSSTGEALLRNEAHILRMLKEMQTTILKTPTIGHSTLNQMLVLSNVRPDTARETASIEDRHLDGLEELYAETKKERTLGELPMIQDVQERLADMDAATLADPSLDSAIVHRILQNLHRLEAGLDMRRKIPVALAHGDFTPWNMYVSDKAIHVYDWELARPSMPLMYDLFHFVYQSGILLLRQPFPDIHRELSRTFRLPACVRLVQRFGVDKELMHKLYLLSLVSYYMKIYLRETNVHMQVHWLMDTWDKALIDILN